MRSLFAGVAVLVLAGACAMSAEAPSASMAMEAVKAPVAIESKFATSPDGTKIHYNASGSGPLVIAIHGFPDFSASWDKLAPALNDKYRFVALDTRGYNLSDKPTGVANYAMPKLVEDVQAVIKASASYPELRPMWGLHPCHVDAGWEEVLHQIKPLFQEHPACAVGEIGLDLYWSSEFAEEQKKALEAQLNWALEFKLPVSLHTRNACAEAIEIVKPFSEKGLRGVFHCFSGTESEAL